MYTVFPDSIFHFHSFHFYWNSLFFIIFPLENVQHSVFPCFPPWLFRPRVVLYVYMFPTDTLLTEFVKQHLTRHIEVIRKLLGPLFWCKLRVLCFFCGFASFSDGRLDMLRLCGRESGTFVTSVTGVPMHEGPPRSRSVGFIFISQVCLSILVRKSESPTTASQERMGRMQTRISLYNIHY